MLLGQLQQKGLLWCEVRNSECLGLLEPAITVGFVAVVAFDVEVLTEHFELSLYGPQITFYPRIFELSVQFAGSNFPATRDAVQQFDCQEHCFGGVRAFGHIRLSKWYL